MARNRPRSERDQQDLHLLENVASKDKKAFEALYARYHPQLMRYLTRMLRRPELAEEVFNDTMFVVWEKARQFEGRSKVSTWVTGIAYLKGLKALEKVKMSPGQQFEDLSEVENLEDSQDLIQKLGLGEWLVGGLDRISEDQRAVVELTYFFGYSYIEIAEIMDCPVNTVKTRMFHARRRLKKLLPQLEEQTKVSRQKLAQLTDPDLLEDSYPTAPGKAE